MLFFFFFFFPSFYGKDKPKYFWAVRYEDVRILALVHHRATYISDVRVIPVFYSVVRGPDREIMRKINCHSVNLSNFCFLLLMNSAGEVLQR